VKSNNKESLQRAAERTRRGSPRGCPKGVWASQAPTEGKGHKRQDRVASLITRQLATILLREHINPLFVGTTITAVRVSPDLAHAKVFVTVLNDAKIEETINALNKSSALLQHLVAKKVKLRIVTKLFFVYDTSIEYAKKMVRLIDKAITSNKLSDE
jgi:ribosome-binding factor A